jgi:hypothetical protein
LLACAQLDFKRLKQEGTRAATKIGGVAAMKITGFPKFETVYLIGGKSKKSKKSKSKKSKPFHTKPSRPSRSHPVSPHGGHGRGC